MVSHTPVNDIICANTPLIWKLCSARFILWNQDQKYLHYLWTVWVWKLWRFCACLGGCWTRPPPTCYRRRLWFSVKCLLSFVFLLLTFFGLKNTEKCLFWLPLRDKDSTKQGFGIHASWIPYFVRYFVNLHLAWPGDPKAAWQVNCCCCIPMQRSFFGWILNGCQ